MVVKRYKCKKCTWRFLLDLENKVDTFGRPIDRRTILHDHMVEEHDYANIIENFILVMRAYFETEEL